MLGQEDPLEGSPAPSYSKAATMAVMPPDPTSSALDKSKGVLIRRIKGVTLSELLEALGKTHLGLQHIQRASKSVILSVKGCPPKHSRRRIFSKPPRTTPIVEPLKVRIRRDSRNFNGKYPNS
ncbi:Heat-inducible transcription repressor HrcA [Folsomia candida]|uniref:Heat-inducible transcription repressor HrcA n=1 Tax=Folsomia candida TaxID=158441 RepID=A0A226DWG6_FOLCA|nr:Heat-inducible transcription repressor HrcA [Folsomia candida]